MAIGQGVYNKGIARIQHLPYHLQICLGYLLIAIQVSGLTIYEIPVLQYPQSVHWLPDTNVIEFYTTLKGRKIPWQPGYVTAWHYKTATPSVGGCVPRSTYGNASEVSLGHMTKYCVHDDIIVVGEVLKSKGLTGADPLCLPGQPTEGVIGLQI